MAKRDSVSGEDAISMLKADHRKVEALFREFESTDDEEQLETLADEIVQELKVHAELEERIFYPAVRAAFGEKDSELVMEAVLEHGSMKMLIRNIEEASSGDELFKPSVKVLKEYVQHHVKEEENEMFPKASRADLDLEALGAEMAELKESMTAGTDGIARIPGELERLRPQSGAGR